MNRRQISGVVAVVLAVLGVPVLSFGQGPPVGPAPVAPVANPGPHVPVTVVVSLDGVAAKLLQGLQAPPGPPLPPPPGPAVFPGKKKGLLQKIREKKPLQTLVAKQLEALSQPVNLGGNLWLSLNLDEVVFQGFDFNLGTKQLTVPLAVHLEPMLVLSKTPPPPRPLPQFAFGKEMPPPAPGGTPLNIFLKIDPKMLPQVLPAETNENLVQYGIDCAKIGFSQQPGPGGPKVTVTVPLQKPVAAKLTIWFTPQVKKNVLTFLNPDCTVTLPDPAPKEADAIKLALQKVTQETIRALVISKFKSAAVDFSPHLKKLAGLPLAPAPGGPPPKVQAALTNLHVAALGVEDNHLVVRIGGVVAPGGIVIFAP
jgi:hypothetical protein